MKKSTIDAVLDFRDQRNWSQFHNGKDLALSLVLEASELLEVYQWSGEDLEVAEKLDKIKEELADVFMYSILLADKYQLDIDDIIKTKLETNNKKYPAELARNHKEKYNELKELARREKGHE